MWEVITLTSPPPSGNQDLEILPLAPLPPPRQLWEQEEDVLRDLRLFLRGVTESLMVERRFKIFSRPVDIEEVNFFPVHASQSNHKASWEVMSGLLQVPDYLMVIKKPMDLSTLLTNIDEHKYTTVCEFLEDAELIWKNALEYNPDSDPLGRFQLLLLSFRRMFSVCCWLPWILKGCFCGISLKAEDVYKET